MSNNVYYSKTTLTGGVGTALDSIDGTGLGNGDWAYVAASGILYVYVLNATSGATPSSPSIISPATNAGTKRWILQTTSVSEPIGVIKAYAGASAPTGYLMCDGSSISTTTYAGLYTIIGYTFGGSGGSFNVPDLRSRSPIGAGTGPGLTNRVLGVASGEETHAIITAEMASHYHNFPAWATGNELAGYGLENVPYFMDRVMVSSATSTQTATSGSGTAHNNMQPFLVLNFIIKT